jgi:NADH:ubiquinone oxidoreductase subunit C
MEEEDMTERWITSLGKVYNTWNNTVFMDIPKKDIMKVIEKVRERDARIGDVAGYDNGKDYEISYTFMSGREVFTLRTRIPRKKPEIESITKIFPGAELMEREAYESLGISFPGNPYLKKILHDKTTPKTPLRKEVRK